MLSLLIQLLVTGVYLAGLLLSARLLCAPFSAKIRAQIRRHRLLHLAGAALWVLLFVFVFYPGRPPDWWQRRGQREEVLQRVHFAGGWDALRRDCRGLADRCEREPDRPRYALKRNNLPPAIAALKPWRVDYYGPRIESFNDSMVPIVRVTLFGARGTREPVLGLDVVCAPSTTNYEPHRVRAAGRLRNWRYRKVADDVYEFY